ncbi:alpha/beta hydrolase [Oceanobacillus piezotolerans]|uniref:Alpha/beta hydrolase n=1 Tax=Oceanobacillus piezotolerans TaxID=2448030 RepID=A0A498D6R1_9BACI|nr:alpha/beta hydrolase [Oceanobacillus piezotolerans]RLL41105.1 alpha/beta hydrolase [Oceanobacillus piezotolerans]
MAFFETSDGVKLYYQEKGEGNPIVFIHGWGMDHTSFEPTFEALSESYRVVSYDLRGFGSSEKAQVGYTLNRFAQDLEELMGFLDLNNVTLAGHSMGTSIIFDYVRTFGNSRLKSVTLLDMTPKLVNDESWNLGLFHGKYQLEDAHHDLTRIFNNMEEFCGSFMRISIPYITEEMFEELMEGMKLNSPFVLAGMWHAMAVNDYRDVLEKITVPAQIIYGEKSTLYSKETAEYLHQHIANSEVIPFENCTHMLVSENPAKLTEVMNEIASLS